MIGPDVGVCTHGVVEPISSVVAAQRAIYWHILRVIMLTSAGLGLKPTTLRANFE